MPKVFSMKCCRYELELVSSNLKTAMDGLGGIHTLMRPGSRVFLKVNLLTGRKPSEGVTTHPVVVQALASLLVEAGMKVIIGDSPGGPFLPVRMKQVYRITGMQAVAEAAGVQLNENLNVVTADYSKGIRLKQFEFLQGVAEADYVISLCKMKTHSMTLMTGAVKNLFGVMPGLTKAALHFRFPHLTDFADAMVDICEYTQPVLSVMDGIEAMEGAGPSAGTLINANVLLVSTSPYYLDLAACRWMKIDPNDVPLLRAAAHRNLCDLKGSDLEWVGAEPEKERRPFKTPIIQVPDFLNRLHHIPVAGRLVNAFSKQYLQPRPRVVQAACIGCRECHVICPAEAITMGKRYPSFDLGKCIRCFCCQEICPAKAIIIYRSRLLRYFHS
ncbi:MAG: DUF362 domain-containing protein [Bacillota bacterium]|nr:DUF362 domain-containing protein [Bacillota bacterium]MDW7676618.1 DUF362 domain-containing protein [Bacillota bacterium]